MDQIINALASFSGQIIPVLEAIALVCVIVLLIKLIKVMCSLNTTLLKSNNTIDLLDESMEKVQAPLDTVVKVSKSVDKVHDVTVEAIDSAKNFVVNNAGDIKDKVVSYIKTDNKQVDKLEDIKQEDIL